MDSKSGPGTTQELCELCILHAAQGKMGFMLAGRHSCTQRLQARPCSRGSARVGIAAERFGGGGGGCISDGPIEASTAKVVCTCLVRIRQERPPGLCRATVTGGDSDGQLYGAGQLEH
jgi:hypothetical protein